MKKVLSISALALLIAAAPVVTTEKTAEAKKATTEKTAPAAEKADDHKGHEHKGKHHHKKNHKGAEKTVAKDTKDAAQ